MDCYIASLHKLLAREDTSVEQLIFLSNYSVTKCWIDTCLADSFSLPVIYPYWFTNHDKVRQLFPNLVVEELENFDDFVTLVKSKLEAGPVMVPIDRYHLNYISPRRHMGAHFILMTTFSDGMFSYHDSYDGSERQISITMLRIATDPSKNRAQPMGYMALFMEPGVRAKIQIDEDFVRENLGNRVQMLLQTRDELLKLKVRAKTERRLTRFYLKIALGGFRYSDFNGKNGRLENTEIFRQGGMPVAYFAARLIMDLYSGLSHFYFMLYRAKLNGRYVWNSFISAYRLLLNAEARGYCLALSLPSKFTKNLVKGLNCDAKRA